MRRQKRRRSKSNTLALINVTHPVVRFVDAVDSCVSNLAWDIKTWIKGYNLYYYDKQITIHDLVQYYEQHCNRPFAEFKHEQEREDAARALDDIARMAVSQLYPDLHLYLAYRDEDRPFIRDVFLSMLPGERALCEVVIVEDS